MSRAPVEKYHFGVSKGRGVNLAIQAGRRRRWERAGDGKRVLHQYERTQKTQKKDHDACTSK